ncbi:unnamed protein product [Dicrocoelium dendriticum]|nr:unnamed protein product [Dicrocoelium dendriticum]
MNFMLLALYPLVILLRTADCGTILSHTGIINPYNVDCLDDCCEDLEIVEFGRCGSLVELDEESIRLRALRIRFERIFEAYEEGKTRINLTSNYMLVALLLSELQHIQWLLLFRSTSIANKLC